MGNNYVPEIDKASSDYYVACHYFPGWNVYPNGYSAMADILDFPERTPLIGYYDEADPEVIDWEIKWALEHGIQCFIYCWYRAFANVGHPVTNDGLKLNHALMARKKSRYVKMMDYAIMWEIDNAGGVADIDDVTNNLVPFWCQEYFSDDNYLKIDDKPVLFVYDCRWRWNRQYTGNETMADILAAIDKRARELGFKGVHFMVEHRNKSTALFGKYREIGYQNSFAYCYHTEERKPSQETIINTQVEIMNEQIKADPYFPLLTCSQAWDPYPWYRHSQTPEQLARITQWKLTPENWKILLTKVKALSDSMPSDALGHRMIILDNWNEWCEGHYIAPHRSGGFKYLQAVREVLTHCDNLPDYRLPRDIGLGPYDEKINFDAERIWYSF
ncbi:MAG: glycoside hydrolase family 99-like domain-containing protein [Clostridia bacterium]|nr:glycoside hydrolase family 99-like domain-containing protein [Clostridia bacterium]